MVDESIVKSVQNYLQVCRAQGLEVIFGVLFGSQARGAANQWSDIDLVVVSPAFDGVVHEEDVNLLWHMTAYTDNRIEPIPCGERQWLEDSSSAIIEIARREGKQIQVPESIPSVQS